MMAAEPREGDAVGVGDQRGPGVSGYPN